MSINFNVSAGDGELIRRIACRALGLMPNPITSRRSLEMTLTACHANGCPLRLEAMLEAGEFDLLHDVHGLHACIDRKTGKLTNHFLPRFADLKGQTDDL